MTSNHVKRTLLQSNRANSALSILVQYRPNHPKSRILVKSASVLSEGLRVHIVTCLKKLKAISFAVLEIQRTGASVSISIRYSKAFECVSSLYSNKTPELTSSQEGQESTVSVPGKCNSCRCTHRPSSASSNRISTHHQTSHIYSSLNPKRGPRT